MGGATATRIVVCGIQGTKRKELNRKKWEIIPKVDPCSWEEAKPDHSFPKFPQRDYHILGLGFRGNACENP